MTNIVSLYPQKMSRRYTDHGWPISKAENERLNREYWAYVDLMKNGTVSMNNHGFENGKEPPLLSLGHAAEWQADSLFKPKITYTLSKRH